MSAPFDFGELAVPARIADLAFRIAVPRNWNIPDLPLEDVDFSAPGTFFPMLLATAPGEAVVLTVAARPGFGDGTLQDWSLFLLDSQGIRPTSFGPAAIGDLRGLAGLGAQEQEGTRLEFRFAFFEDGGRLVQLGLLTPEGDAARFAAVWETALASFVLERPQGQKVALGTGAGVMAEAAPFAETEFGFYAKSETLETLNPEHPVNAALQEQGVGLGPRLLESDTAGRWARIGAGGIGAVIRVALGWHVIDDGKQTLVLDPDGKIQISLSVIPKEGRSIDQILDGIQEEAEQSYPTPEFLRMADGGIWAIGIRGIAVNGEPVEQVHMLTVWATDAAMLRARVTADPASMRFAADYADLILKSAEYGKQ
jgi:hypothetical protein